MAERRDFSFFLFSDEVEVGGRGGGGGAGVYWVIRFV